MFADCLFAINPEKIAAVQSGRNKELRGGTCLVSGMAYHARPASSREHLREPQQQQPLQLTSLREFALAAAQLPAVASGRLGPAMGLGRQQQRQHGHNTRASAAAAAHSGGAAAWVLAPSKGDGRCLFRSLAQVARHHIGGCSACGWFYPEVAPLVGPTLICVKTTVSAGCGKLICFIQ